MVVQVTGDGSDAGFALEFLVEAAFQAHAVLSIVFVFADVTHGPVGQTVVRGFSLGGILSLKASFETAQPENRELDGFLVFAVGDFAFVDVDKLAFLVAGVGQDAFVLPL